MDVQSVLPSFYRQRLREALRGRLAPVNQPPSMVQDVVVVPDQPELSSLEQAVPTAPQGIDPKAKHAALDKKREQVEMPANPERNDYNVHEPDPVAEELTTEQAHQYRVHSNLDISELRQRMERHVRRVKRQRKPCPYRTSNGQCSKVFIRCGERSQFSVRESGQQQRWHHQCNYYAGSAGDYVLLVDDDPSMLQFCKSSFSLFLQFDEGHIFTAQSADEAIDTITHSKINNQQIGLVICDIGMPGKSGYELVNELFFRNFDTEILLMKSPGDTTEPPENYQGDIEIVGNGPFVSGTLQKPFHSEKLVSTVHSLQFGEHISL